MGGCLSKKTKKAEKKYESEEPAVHCANARRFRPPATVGVPLPEEEEAVVKEVLLETPKPARGEDEVAEQKIKKEEEVSGVRDDRSEEASSEIRSLSESVSVSTTVTERKEGEEEEEVQTKTRRKGGYRSAATKTPQKRNRSASCEYSGRRDQRGGVGRSSPSRVRRPECGISGHSFTGRGAGTAGRTRMQGGSGCRLDPGEMSLRRSVSPATKGVADHRGGVRRNTSLRGNGRTSPSRAAPGSQEDGVRKSKGGPVEADNKESLENPLVSLECFIFL